MKISMIADFKLYQKDKESGLFRLLSADAFDHLTPGGFTFEVNGKAVPFDWDAQSTNEEGGVFHYESGHGPFFNDFEIPDYWDEEYAELGLKREDISPEFLASTSDITEFYVNFAMKGADEDSGIGDNVDSNSCFLIELLSVSFENRETGDVFNVAEDVLKRFNGKIVSYDAFLAEAYSLYKKEWCEARGFDPDEVAKADANDEEYQGQMYVCLSEFEDCEFSDDSYMAAHFPEYFAMRITK